ncbi:MAG: hypothetical protein ABI707_18700 [Ferruginibacter sp.]
MLKLYFLLIVVISGHAFAQNKFDSKIIITVKDTTNLYKTVKIALVNFDFIVKDNYNDDTLTTYPKEIKIFKGMIMCRAILNEFTVTLTGVYGFKSVDFWGFTTLPDTYKRIIYYNGSKTWKLLLKIANKIPGELTYSE